MLSITILTKNSAATLEATLESIRAFPEVIILDTGSTDQTLEIASKFPNVKVFQQEFRGFGPTHNEASSLASSDWIFSLDSDEVVTPELAKEILELSLNPQAVYQINRANYFNQKHIRCCSGWYPDPVIRIYHRKHTRFSMDQVHERVLHKGLTVIPLHSPIRHTPFRNLSDFSTKIQIYSTLFAEQHKHKKQSSLARALFHGSFAFFKSYVLKRGFLGGKEGYIISKYNSQTAYYKYLQLAKANR